ncbi:MAG TPA: sulfatase-like hydrolase/transferase, partial [Longimicrobiales bacterium]|nr:sulfatase-like hydrolase/transferase [Longimicrobiales bacterium]
MRALRRTGLLAGGVLGLAAACGDPPPLPPTDEPRLVILYMPCTVSKGYLSPYAPDVAYTPRLAEFAEESAVFERHVTEAGSSGIAYASILSGGQAEHHGVFLHPEVLAEELHLVAEAYAENGYDTWYWVDHAMASPGLEYDQGVPAENVRERPALAFRIRGKLHRLWSRLWGRTLRHPYPALVAGDSAFRGILERLREDPEYKAFVMTAFSVTHGTYGNHNLERFRREHPEEARGITDAQIEKYDAIYRENLRPLAWNLADTVERLGLSEREVEELAAVLDLLYKSNVSYLDRVFGELVDRVESAGLLDQSLIAFTADHGEVLYREGADFAWSHSYQLAPEVIGVPLLIRGPGVEPGRYAGVTRSMDLFPTLAGLSGLPADAARDAPGVDLSAAVRGEAEPPRLLGPSHTAILHEATHEQMHDPESAHLWTHLRELYPRRDVDLIWVSIRDGDLLYKWKKRIDAGWGMEVFDIARDPEELVDLHDPGDPRH